MDRKYLIQELYFKAVKSSGSGGQHVNKVATKVLLHFNVAQSTALKHFQKERVLRKLKNQINKEGILILSSSQSRSQLQNKKLVIERFINLISGALQKNKKRIATKIPKSVKHKRLLNKRKHAEKKVIRKPPKFD